MAAPMALQRGRHLLLSLLHTCLQHSIHSAGPSTSFLKGRILPYLYNRFEDFESFIEGAIKVKSWNVERKNKYYITIRRRYGDDVAAAAFALFLKGGVRFQGQAEWYQEHNQKQYSVDLANYLHVPLEAVDFSGSIINYNGLGCLANLKALKHLDLSQCPNVDDWGLSRLHVLRESLEELSLAGCPQITERGLGCLHHLEHLRRLDVSDLPSVPHKGLVRILLEEMLPQCEVVGIRYNEVTLPFELDAHRGQMEEPGGVAPSRKTNEVPA